MAERDAAQEGLRVRISNTQAAVMAGLLVFVPVQLSVAQLQAPTSSPSGGAGPMFTAGTQPDAVVINDLEFKVDKLVRNEARRTRCA